MEDGLRHNRKESHGGHKDIRSETVHLAAHTTETLFIILHMRKRRKKRRCKNLGNRCYTHLAPLVGLRIISQRHKPRTVTYEKRIYILEQHIQKRAGHHTRTNLEKSP